MTRTAIFGTDGVRDRAGEGLLAPESVARLARATARVLEERERFPREIPASRGDAIFIGRDTRSSGPELLDCMSEVFQRRGFTVADLGVLPTPAAAYFASVSPECRLAVMLSASHNPARYNGIKVLSATGAKSSAELEEAVTEAYWLDAPAGRAGPSRRGDRRDLAEEAADRYVAFLLERCWRPERLRGVRLALDTAHGAAYRIAPRVFRELGADVVVMGDAPDGANINAGCGALHPEGLARLTGESSSRIGFCFDGDADRMIPVTSAGRVLDGDHVLALAGLAFHRSGRLPRGAVVATVMSNVGLERALEREGLRLIRTPVGDRNVYRELVQGGHPIGGEQSGHVIFLGDSPTGDGLLAALRLLDVLEGDGLDLESESRVMTRYPQVLRNVPVGEKVPFETLPAVLDAVEEAEAKLAGEGRVLLRYSGTESLARVMLEGPEPEILGDLCGLICDVIRDVLPSSSPSGA